MANLNSIQASNNQLPLLAAGSRAPNPSPDIAASTGNTLPPQAELRPVLQADASQSTKQSAEQIEAVAAKLSDFAQSLQRDLSFSVDDDTGKTVIVVKDRLTEEVVRQIPSEDLLQLAQNLLELQEKLESSKGNLLEVRV